MDPWAEGTHGRRGYMGGGYTGDGNTWVEGYTGEGNTWAEGIQKPPSTCDNAPLIIFFFLLLLLLTIYKFAGTSMPL